MPAGRETMVSNKPTVDRIMSAAERVFSRQGYGETSLRQLIAEAGMSTTAFYARFSSKEEVLDALVHELFVGLTHAAEQTLQAASGIDDGFDRGVGTLVEILSPHKETVRLALTEAACSQRSLQTVKTSLGVLAALLTTRIQKLVERGQVDVEDPGVIGWALVGALEMQVTRWAVYEELDDAGLQRALTATARALLPILGTKRRRR